MMLTQMPCNTMCMLVIVISNIY